MTKEPKSPLIACLHGIGCLSTARWVVPAGRRGSAIAAFLGVLLALPGESRAGDLVLGTNEVLHQDLFGNTLASADDQFGLVQAAGDFDGDGYDDLAVGVPYENVLGATDAGQVNVLFGSPDGLRTNGVQVHNWIDGDLPGMSDRYGLALAAGNFDGDAYDDLAIGIPGRTVDMVDGAGAVSVLYGGPTGLTTSGRLLVHQNLGDLATSAEEDDGFGTALTTGDFDHDGYDELVVGVPFEDVVAVVNAGAVHVLRGSGSGLLLTGTQYWNQSSTDIFGTAETDDRFGYSLAAGDFDDACIDALGVDCDDLAIGARGDISGVGAFHVIYGSTTLLSTTDNEYISGANYGHPSEAGDLYAYSLTAGKLLGSDDYEDLVVTSPLGSTNIAVLAGSAQGIHPFAGSWYISGGGDDYHGWSVATADSNDGSGYDSFFYGEPGDDFYAADGGSVHRATSPSLDFDQDSTSMADLVETGDFFGWSLGVGDFNGDGADDLSVGVPFEEVGGLPQDSGAIHVVYTDDWLLYSGFETGDTSEWSG